MLSYYKDIYVMFIYIKKDIYVTKRNKISTYRKKKYNIQSNII